MEFILNIIVLVFEILYYSLFMKSCRNKNKLYKYFILFTLITIIMFFISTNQLYTYLIFILLTLYGLKYIVKLEVTLYDMFIIVVMLLLKLIIELPIYVILSSFTNYNFILTIVSSITKVLLALGLKNKIKLLYIKGQNLWYKNNFYIRYIFSILMFIFTICSCIFLIVKLGGM